MPGGRKYVAINRKLRIYRRLLKFLRAIDKRYPAKREAYPSYRWRMWNDEGQVTSERLDLMFFSPVRSRVLLYVAPVGATDMQTMYDQLGIGSVSALYAVNHWEREGVVKTERLGRHRIVSLNDAFHAAKELRPLLDGLVSCNTEYLAYASPAVRR